jgi:hypothetical protein
VVKKKKSNKSHGYRERIEIIEINIKRACERTCGSSHQGRRHVWAWVGSCSSRDFINIFLLVLYKKNL